MRSTSSEIDEICGNSDDRDRKEENAKAYMNRYFSATDSFDYEDYTTTVLG